MESLSKKKTGLEDLEISQLIHVVKKEKAYSEENINIQLNINLMKRK